MNHHTYENNAAGYQQQFDGKGHPVNEVTTRANRRMRRAQNEVLQVVGVVRSKHNQAKQLARRHSLSDDELVGMVNYENVTGSFLRASCLPLMDSSVWWLMSFRSRLGTFRSYLEPGIMSALRSEQRILGRTSFFISGLAYSIVADELRDQRYWLTAPAEADGDAAELLWSHWIFQRLKDLGVFAIEWPIRARGTLQGLGLLPFRSGMSWYHLLPMVSISPIYQLTTSPSTASSAHLRSLAAFIFSPFVAAYVLEQIREGLESRIHTLLHRIIPRPSRPDRLSVDGKVEELENFVGCVPRLGFNLFPARDLDSASSFYDLLKSAFPAIFNALEWLKHSRRRSRIDPSELSDLLQAARTRYGDLLRVNQCRPRREQLPDDELRRMAISQAFAEAQIDPRGSSVNIHQWADDILSNDGVSTATPDPEDLFPRSETILDNHATRAPSPSDDEGMPGHNPFAPAVPLETLLEPTALHEVTMPPLISPPTPVQGISRAASLTQPPNQQNIMPRPVRRPTELDGNSPATPSTMSLAPGYLTDPVPDRAPSPIFMDPDSTSEVYRVTVLSTLPADSLARLGSSFLTSVLMFPLEMYQTRRLANAFLESATHTSPRLEAIARDVGPIRPTSSIFSMGTFWLSQKVLLTFGIEAVLRGVGWGAGAQLSAWMGRQWFLWGVA